MLFTRCLTPSVASLMCFLQTTLYFANGGFLADMQATGVHLEQTLILNFTENDPHNLSDNTTGKLLASEQLIGSMTTVLKLIARIAFGQE